MPDAREAILDRLRAARAARRPDAEHDAPVPPVRPAPTAVTRADGDRAQLAVAFGERLAALSGSCEILQTAAELPERIARRIQDWSREEGHPSTGVSREEAPLEVLSWGTQELPLSDLGERLGRLGILLWAPDDLHDSDARQRAAALRVGLTGVEAAFASTGSVVVAAGSGKSRAASLLPTHHLAVVPMSRIYPTAEAWLASLRRQDRLNDFLRQSGQVVVITGPSKSADIELNLTLGVHGPRFVHAVVFDDTR